MNDITACRLLYCLEQLGDMNRFRVGGEPLWPYFRYVFCTSFVAYDFSEDLLSENHPEFQLRRTVDEVFAQFPLPDDEADEASVLPPARQIAIPARAHAVFYARPEEHFLTTAQGEITAPILDPWIAATARLAAATKFEIATAPPQFAPRRLIPTVRLAAEMEPFSPPAELAAVAADLQARVEKLVSMHFGVALPSLVDRLIQTWAAVETHAGLFARNLEALNATAVFLTCYYHPAGYGLCKAAHRLGLPAVEVQHGMNGYHHWGYTHWSSFPEEKYPVFPTDFAVWSLHSARNLVRWHHRGAGRPRVTIAGRPEMAAAATGAALPGDLAAFRKAHPFVVLVTLQDLPSLGLTEETLDLIRAAPPEWGWLLRLHPLTRNSQNRIRTPEEGEAFLAAHGIANAAVATATDHPLSEVLRVTDHHVTHLSSCVVECLAASIPSTCIQPLGRDTFADFLKAGNIRLASSVPEAVAAIAAGWEGLNRPRPETFMDTRPEIREAAIREVLGRPTAVR